ncbi:MAG: 16S rRNA (adenine(1518)-N(6)/adenine(1519)-N(6))-dimethyltransferase, partial [Spirochaetota bacterium]
YPSPEVISSIIGFTPNSKYSFLKEKKLFFNLVHDLFASRRKTIKNNLRASSNFSFLRGESLYQILKAAHINPDCRGESLSVDDITRLAVEISHYQRFLPAC